MQFGQTGHKNDNHYKTTYFNKAAKFNEKNSSVANLQWSYIYPGVLFTNPVHIYRRWILDASQTSFYHTYSNIILRVNKTVVCTLTSSASSQFSVYSFVGFIISLRIVVNESQ